MKKRHFIFCQKISNNRYYVKKNSSTLLSTLGKNEKSFQNSFQLVIFSKYIDWTHNFIEFKVIRARLEITRVYVAHFDKAEEDITRNSHVQLININTFHVLSSRDSSSNNNET